MNNPAKIFKGVSFHTRIRLGMVVVILVVIVIGTLLSIYLQNQNQFEAMNTFGRYVAVNLSENSLLGILSEEPENLKYAVNAAVSDRRVIGVDIFLANGELLASRKKQDYLLDKLDTAKLLKTIASSTEPSIVIQTQTTSGRQLRSYLAKAVVRKADDDIFTTQTADDRFFGYVRVDMSLQQLNAQKATILLRNLLLMPLYFIIGMILSVLIEKQISRPLLQLKAATSAVKKGDFTTKLKIRTNDELGILARAFDDMSKQLAATIDRLNQTNQNLEKANRELQDFTYIVSHDLQEPLRKIYSFGQFLIEDCSDTLSDEGKDYIERIQKASIKMKQLIQDLLKLSRVETSTESYVRINTNDVIKEATDDLAVIIKETETEIIADNLPDVFANRIQLTQLFENLLGNAIKYRSKKRKPKIEISAQQQNGQVTFLVKDNGIGIEKRFHDKIFGVFQRLHTSDEYEGTGIGLALCEKVVRRHGGKIWLESTPDEGTAFYFTIPKVVPKTDETSGGE